MKKITKAELKKIIKEERSKLLSESRVTEEADMMADFNSIATAIENIADELYGMGEHIESGAVSGDAGDEMAKQLEEQVERLNTLYGLMVSYFESMDPESQDAATSQSAVDAYSSRTDGIPRERR